MGAFDGRVAIVTGGAGGIGQAVCRRLARDGCAVVIVDVRREPAEAVAAALATAGARVVALPADVADEHQVEELVARTLGSFGRLDILVNNAAASMPRLAAQETPLDTWQRSLAVNLTGAFLCARAAARPMLQQRYGRIVNVLAIQAWVPLPRNAAYAVAKGGLLALTRSLAIDLAPYGVLVNAVAPGLVYVEGDSVQPERDRASPNLLGRMGRPEEVAEVIAFLASEACTYVIGEVIRCDGGRLLSRKGDPDWLA
jgi:3-oxoacyl-[acyl-carrier protein] reductase